MAPTPRILLAPPPPGDWGLVGRTNELLRIGTILSDDDSRSEFAIIGMGGIGKSALACEFLRQEVNNYDLIAWFHAEKPELLPGQYQDLIRIRTGEYLGPEEAISAAKALLANSRRWLIVFDNVQSRQGIENYIPSGAGHVLFTSRNENWSAEKRHVLTLEPLSNTSVRDWISPIIDASQDATTRLIERLGGLPLAIVQALAYLQARPGESIERMLGRLSTKAGQAVVYSEGRPAGYPEPVARTWEMSFEALRADEPDGPRMLEYLSCVSPDGIVIELLHGLLPDRDAIDIIAMLRKYGLIRVTDHSVIVHRLIQDVIQWNTEDADNEKLLARWATHLLTITSESDGRDSFALHRQIAPHALCLLDQAITLNTATPLADLADRVGMSLNDQAMHELAVSVLSRAVLLRSATASQDSVSKARSLGYLGIAYRGQGLQRISVSVQLEALDLLADLPGRPSLELPRLLDNLGRALVRNGRYRSALTLHRYAYGLNQASAGGEIAGAASQINQGAALVLLGVATDAIEVLHRALITTQAHVEANSPRLGWVLENLGKAYVLASRYIDARETFQRSLGIYHSAYGPKHRDTALSISGLGTVASALGQHNDAVRLHQQALAIFRALYGQSHTYIARTLNCLGADVAADGRIDEAITWHSQALTLVTPNADEEPRDFADTLGFLGRAQLHIGQSSDAERLLVARAETLRTMSDADAATEIILASILARL